MMHWWLTDEMTLRFLETTPDAVTSDTLLCHWLRIERLADYFHWDSLHGDVLELLPAAEKGMGEYLEKIAALDVPRKPFIFLLLQSD